MKTGDLVQFDGARCFLLRMDPQTRMAALVYPDGRKVEVPDTLDVDDPVRLQVVANPSSEWPMVACPTKRGAGPVIRVTVPPRNRELRQWVDWMPADPLRAGGTIFFNPALRLSGGDLLLATHRSGFVSRITVPLKFGTVAQRVAAVPAPRFEPQPERTRFNRDDLDIRLDEKDE